LGRAAEPAASAFAVATSCVAAQISWKVGDICSGAFNASGRLHLGSRHASAPCLRKRSHHRRSARDPCACVPRQAERAAGPSHTSLRLGPMTPGRYTQTSDLFGKRKDTGLRLRWRAPLGGARRARRSRPLPGCGRDRQRRPGRGRGRTGPSGFSSGRRRAARVLLWGLCWRAPGARFPQISEG
jgi:hypothetical protein